MINWAVDVVSRGNIFGEQHNQHLLYMLSEISKVILLVNVSCTSTCCDTEFVAIFLV